MRLTGGEQLRVARLRAGLTQFQVARLVGRPQNAVARWEASEEGAPPEVWREAGLTEPGTVSPGEEARILRERLGLTHEKVRYLLGWHEKAVRRRSVLDPPISHVHVIRMEHGEADASVYLGVLRTLVERSERRVGQSVK